MAAVLITLRKVCKNMDKYEERIWEELTGQAGDNELEGKVQGSG